jgi:hypothetical protein
VDITQALGKEGKGRDTVMGVAKRYRFPKGFGYLIGISVGISMFAFIGVTLNNFFLGFACLISGISIGMAIENISR